MCRHPGSRGAGPQTANHPQPGGNGLAQQSLIGINERLFLQWEPKIWRVAAKSLAKKSRRSNADHGKWMALDEKSRPDNGRVAAVCQLPDMMTQHGHGWRCRLIIFWRDDPSAKG